MPWFCAVPASDHRHSLPADCKDLKGHWIRTDAAKDLIYSRLRMVPKEDGSLPDGWRHYPQSYTRTFFEQLTAENVKIEYKRGKEERRYRNDKHLRNDALDLSVYNLAASRMRSWNFEAIAADLAARAEELRTGKPKPAKDRRSAVHRFMRSSRYDDNWVRGGNPW